MRVARGGNVCCSASADEAAAITAPASAPSEQPTPAADAARPPFSYKLHKWQWRGHTISYTTVGCGPPLLLVHGFGASCRHWRFNLPVLAAAGYKVYAVDLLGFGGSMKPILEYTMELWRDQLTDFVDEFIGPQPLVLVGNSLGSLAALMVAADAAPGRIAGTALINCAGGMNNKAIADDWRIKALLPLFLFIDWLLNQRPIAQRLFDAFRGRDNVRSVLMGVYPNNLSVDDELVDLIYAPSCDEGALDAFVSIITGEPGPRPEELVPRLQGPLLLLWGDADNFTPMDGPVGRYFQALPGSREGTQFVVLPGAGHCPHDEEPDVVHAQLLPWLRSVHV